MNKTMRPARYVRGGEALSVASRGEHGHHPVITLPMNRFCPDQIESGRAALPVPTFSRFAFSMYPGQSRRQWVPSGVCVAFPSISGRAYSLGMGERRDLHER